ncbi:MAG: hypothetical protein IPP94_14465 [Ignavibacteria bacterium]|nr:hypothetical protein [Ignavibacteria bacterium]
MSACVLQIRLSNNESRFQTGGVVRGTARVTAEKSCHINGVVLQPVWSVGGWVTDGSGKGAEVRVGEECDVEAGAELSYPFQLTLPDAPASYEGTLFTISWEIAGRVDIALGLDAREKIPITVVQGPSGARPAAGADFDAEKQRTRQSRVNRYRFLRQSSGAMVAALVLFIIAAATGNYTNPDAGDLFLQLLLIAAGIAAYVVFSAGARRNAQRGDITVQLDPLVPHRGATVSCVATLVLRSGARIGNAAARLELREYGSRQSGKHTQTRHHGVWFEEHQFPVNDDIAAVVPRDITMRIPIPSDLPATMTLSSAHFEWRLLVRLEFATGGPWEDEIPVAVAP